MKVLPFGDKGWLVELGSTSEVHRVLRAMRDSPPAGVEEIVPGARTILVIGSVQVEDVLAVSPSNSEDRAAPPARLHIIPTLYDGPDLDEVATLTGLDRGGVVRIHSQPEYMVAFMGFSPGFAYLSGGDQRLEVARRDVPRTSVPAGSVAIASGMTAIYPQSTPGGWMLIGRTDTAMFDPARPEPALLAPGDRVRFDAVDKIALASLPALRMPLPPVPRGAPSIEVLDPGPLLTIQDLGRFGWAHCGVPVAGAADRRSAVRANTLAGNPAGAALLESTFGSCRLRLRAERTVAITGAECDITVDGIPARADAPLPLRPGTEIGLGPCRSGVRVYIAVSGGLYVPPVLGSRSTDTLSGLGPAPLGAGHVVALGANAAPSPMTRPQPAPPAAQSEVEVRARLGPRDDWLSPQGYATLTSGRLRVSPASDRTGLRLDGEPVGLARTGQIPSEGMVAGAVQIPPGGQPIVLMRNHPPTGGYPVVAVVDDDGVDALAQAPPGTPVRFLISRDRTPASRSMRPEAH